MNVDFRPVHILDVLDTWESMPIDPDTELRKVPVTGVTILYLRALANIWEETGGCSLRERVEQLQEDKNA